MRIFSWYCTHLTLTSILSLPLIPLVIQEALGNISFEVTYPLELAGQDDLASERVFSLLGQNDVILLGGTATNQVTRLAVDLLSKKREEDRWIRESLPLAHNDGEYWVKHEGFDQMHTEYFPGAKPSPSTMAADYGIFLVRPNCFFPEECPDSRIILCYGAHTYGTEAAASAYFALASAAQIARTAPARRGWNRYINGLVRIYGDGTLVTSQHKRFQILAPKLLADLTFQNPNVMALPRYFWNVRIGTLFDATLYFFGICGACALVFGFFTGSDWFSISGLIAILAGSITIVPGWLRKHYDLRRRRRERHTEKHRQIPNLSMQRLEPTTDTEGHYAAALFTIRGYVTELRYPHVEVVVEEQHGNETRRTPILMPRALFEKEGLLNQGDRFIYRLFEKDGTIVSTVRPDLDFEDVPDKTEVERQITARIDAINQELKIGSPPV